MKYQVHIDRLVIDRHSAAPQEQIGLPQQLARTVQQQLLAVTPEDRAADLRTRLESGIATAVQQALRRGARS